MRAGEIPDEVIASATHSIGVFGYIRLLKIQVYLLILD